MTKETKRFLVILLCTALVLIGADLAVQLVRNQVEAWRFRRVQPGMSEAQAIKLTGVRPYEDTIVESTFVNGNQANFVTNRLRSIAQPWHASLLVTLFERHRADPIQRIIIETGRVTSVQAEPLMDFVD